MSNTNTGGPAFPTAEIFHDGVVYTGGMTLRDYFAAKAMQSIYQRNVDWAHDGGLPMDEETLQVITEVAQDAYEMADAMLKARQA